MLDVIFMIVDIGCLIAFIFFIRAENRNTKVRREQIKQIKKEQELLDKMNKRVDMISKLQASYKQVKEGGRNED
jgi:hypothetical protein